MTKKRDRDILCRVLKSKDFFLSISDYYSLFRFFESPRSLLVTDFKRFWKQTPDPRGNSWAILSNHYNGHLSMGRINEIGPPVRVFRRLNNATF
jgi:hypothetical protein